MMFARSMLVGFLLAGFSGTAAAALDPLHTDIVTLRLGMTRPEIEAQLAVQGYKPVPDGPGSVQAGTRDGVLHIAFSPDGHARRIAYAFNGRGPNEGSILRTAMLDHYGQPEIQEPLTWCASTAHDGRCRPDQPLLTFGAGKEGRIVLTLAMNAEP